MSVNNSPDSENSQCDSDYNFISDYVFEDERQERFADSDTADYECDAYMDEPLADDEWLLEYNKHMTEQKERQEELTKRLNGVEPIQFWCKCGNCKIQHLQSERECACLTSLSDGMVLEDVLLAPSCITLHPGFRPVCLEKWSLRTSAKKYKCRDKTRYKQKGSEASFLRSVAYRAFTYLVHGFLGNKRIALPACAYHAIREQFKDVNEQFTGFEDEDTD